MFSAPVFLLFFNLTFVASRIYVPYIYIEHPGFEQKIEVQPTDEGYKLLFNHNVGYLEEEVKEVSPGELEVKGDYRQDLGNKLILHVVYEAGRNGYVAKWRMYTNIDISSTKASAAFLRSTIG